VLRKVCRLEPLPVDNLSQRIEVGSTHFFAIYLDIRATPGNVYDV